MTLLFLSRSAVSPRSAQEAARRLSRSSNSNLVAIPSLSDERRSSLSGDFQLLALHAPLARWSPDAVAGKIAGILLKRRGIFKF